MTDNKTFSIGKVSTAQCTFNWLFDEFNEGTLRVTVCYDKQLQ
jgi:hypothetical protein